MSLFQSQSVIARNHLPLVSLAVVSPTEAETLTLLKKAEDVGIAMTVFVDNNWANLQQLVDHSSDNGHELGAVSAIESDKLIRTDGRDIHLISQFGPPASGSTWGPRIIACDGRVNGPIVRINALSAIDCRNLKSATPVGRKRLGRRRWAIIVGTGAQLDDAATWQGVSAWITQRQAEGAIIAPVSAAVARLAHSIA
jgi:hypothetical protein